jgi:hypothetical protein
MHSTTGRLSVELCYFLVAPKNAPLAAFAILNFKTVFAGMSCATGCPSAEWVFNDQGRTAIWNLFLNAASPVGYNPAIVPAWTSPTCEAFAVIKMEPWRLRVFPGRVLLREGGQVLTWRKQDTEPAGA